MTQPSSGVEPGDSAHEEHESHGHSTAAWTGVLIILVGAVVMALAMAGYGDKASTYEAAHRDGGRGAELPGRSQDDSGTQ
jgi:hypothetical protein